MKRRFLFLLVLALGMAAAECVCAQARTQSRAKAQEFNEAYAATEFAVRFGLKLYYGAVRPVWTDAESFVFQTNEPFGEGWYKVSGTVKEPVARDVYDEAVKARRSRYYDPSDESQYAHKREVKEPSPDSLLVAFIRDNNVWVGDREGANAFPLTYDGTDGDAYSEIRWSPDSRKFATFRWDMSMVKPFWVINSITEPRPTLETYKYQMPGEPGPKPYLYIMDTEGNAKAVKVVAFKDQECGILDAVRTAKDRYNEFRGSRWMGDDRHFWLIRQSRDIKRVDLCRVDVDADSTRTVVVDTAAHATAHHHGQSTTKDTTAAHEVRLRRFSVGGRLRRRFPRRHAQDGVRHADALRL